MADACTLSVNELADVDLHRDTAMGRTPRACRKDVADLQQVVALKGKKCSKADAHLACMFGNLGLILTRIVVPFPEIVS